jgi:hypothetical protein
VPADYARQPDAFFADALRLGTGGTCFESNLALRALLDAIGFTGTLAFCDMETATIEPHCAAVVTLNGARYLADVGYPIPAALPLDPQAVTDVPTPVYAYRAAPDAPDRWQVDRVSEEFQSVCFWVNAAAIDEARFQTRLRRDHQPDGLFLDEVIVQVIDRRGVRPDEGPYAGEVWRYSEGKGLVRRIYGREVSVELTPAEQADLPGTLARRFRMDRRVLAAALNRTAPVGVWA